jgi:membrane protein required for colicin V production
LAAVRGLTREVLAIASWAAAAAVAWVFHPQLLPILKQYIPNDMIALIASIASLFLVTLIVVSLVTARISDFVLDSRIGALDRTLGFIFGAARGALLAVVGFMFFTWLAPDDKNQPIWIRDSKIRPMLISAGDSLRALLPDNPEETLRKLRGKTPEGEAPREPEPVPQKRTDIPAPASNAPANSTSATLAPVTTGSTATMSPQDRAGLQRLIDGGQRPQQNR